MRRAIKQSVCASRITHDDNLIRRSSGTSHITGVQSHRLVFILTVSGLYTLFLAHSEPHAVHMLCESNRSETSNCWACAYKVNHLHCVESTTKLWIRLLLLITELALFGTSMGSCWLETQDILKINSVLVQKYYFTPMISGGDDTAAMFLFHEKM